MSFLIAQFIFSIFVKENLKFKWQCSQYLNLNHTSALAQLREGQQKFGGNCAQSHKAHFQELTKWCS